MENLTSLEEPLKGSKGYHRNPWQKPVALQGPKKVLKLCLLGIILPGILISVPLYLKHRVYDYQMYPVGMSDMRLIDSKVSTTWCQKQIIKTNATFNAFLLADSPTLAKDRLNVEMTRHLVLSDDMKEYWGFYLLKDSKVTVSTCVRWPGASLILIRGHRHLHECAYIGDDSSEELDELMEIAAEKGLLNGFQSSMETDEDGKSNNPSLLTKHRPEIQFHDPILKQNAESYTFSPNQKHSIEDDLNTKQMSELLSKLSEISQKIKSINNEKLDDQNFKRKIHPHIVRQPSIGNNEENNIKLTDTTINSDVDETSSEIFQNVLRKLNKMGPKGKRVLELLKNELLLQDNIDKSSDQKHMDDLEENLEKIQHKDISPEVKTSISQEKVRQQKEETQNEKLLRLKRELIIQTVMSKEFNEDNEKDNLAIEEGYNPDGIADHHHILNETTLNDRSNSEFWSSFSSSEEALLNCAGLILSLPLNPNRHCTRQNTDNDFERASFANRITYTVPTNGYYFFVFNSENEVQENYIRVNFQLEKTMYNVTNSLSKCNNTTNECNFQLKFFSNEKVVFEMPVAKNDSLWNEEFIVISECEPRTAIYLICILAVPLFILIFAFQ